MMIYTFSEHNLKVSGEEADLIRLAEVLRDEEGTLGDLRFQIEVFFDIDGLGSDCQDEPSNQLHEFAKNENNMDIKIYTRDVAAQIVELFEDILSKHDIHVPSPEDDERDPDNDIGLYGSTYSELLDEVENILLEVQKKAHSRCYCGSL